MFVLFPAVQHERGPRHSTLRRQLALCLKNSPTSPLAYTAAAAAAAVAMATVARRNQATQSTTMTTPFSPHTAAAAMQVALHGCNGDVTSSNANAGSLGSLYGHLRQNGQGIITNTQQRPLREAQEVCTSHVMKSHLTLRYV